MLNVGGLDAQTRSLRKTRRAALLRKWRPILAEDMTEVLFIDARNHMKIESLN